MWLAQVGRERIEEVIDPELTIERALETYAKKGYSREWINQRLQAIQVRKELTDEWDKRGVKKGKEYAILTDEITKAWSGMTTRQYKNHKGLKKENPRKMLKVLIMNQLLIVYSAFKLCGRDAFIAFKHFAKVTGCAEPAFICDVFNCSCGIDQ